MMSTILSRLTTLEEHNKVLQERLIAVEERNAELEVNNEKLEETLWTTMEAVLGVSSSIGYQHILLTYLPYRTASPSTRYEIEFFWTWAETNWPGSVATKIVRIGRPVSTGRHYLTLL